MACSACSKNKNKTQALNESRLNYINMAKKKPEVATEEVLEETLDKTEEVSEVEDSSTEPAEEITVSVPVQTNNTSRGRLGNTMSPRILPRQF